jgi:hypothetical protein
MSMSSSATQDDPRQVIKDVAAIVGGVRRDDYLLDRGTFATCWSIYCETESDCIDAIEEAAANGLRGSRMDAHTWGFVAYWPAVH